MKIFGWCLVSLATALGADTAVPVLAPETVVANYESSRRTLDALMRGVSMDMEIEARLPKLKRQGRLHALRRISRLGRISYESLGFEGDGSVKNQVIARYLSAEAQTQDGPSLAITPANYKFRYRGITESEGRPVHVFRLTPRQKRVGLFKGELWLDAQTCLPVRESGRFVKSPSVFLRRIEFVRNYDILGDVAVPRRIVSVVDTRLVGRAELTVVFGAFIRDDQPAAMAAETTH